MNIREIAKAANVSPATVSRILNQKGNVHEKTREKVLQIIEKHNYVPNGIARSMAKGTTQTIGLILPDITNPFFTSIARGIEDTASTHGFKVVLCNSDNDPKIQEQYLYMVQEQRMDGVILISASDESEFTWIKHMLRDTPIVLCDRVPVNMNADYVHTDHYKGAFLALEHLITFGHREISMIKGPEIPSSVERIRAFYEVCRKNEITPRQDQVVQGDFGYESGYDGMKKILLHGLPTAVFCANDMMAFGAIDAIFDAGYEVPNDISVVGYDNILFSKFSRPALTTVSQPTYLIGVTAVELLLASIQGNERGNVGRVLEPTLIVRNSTTKVVRHGTIGRR